MFRRTYVLHIFGLEEKQSSLLWEFQLRDFGRRRSRTSRITFSIILLSYLGLPGQGKGPRRENVLGLPKIVPENFMNSFIVSSTSIRIRLNIMAINLYSGKPTSQLIRHDELTLQCLSLPYNLYIELRVVPQAVLG